MEDPVHYDSRRRAITAGERTSVLQEKCWQVLSALRERAPSLVSREEVIDLVWQGNYLTGEKGLNQSLWAIRAALGDDARAPRFIRTLPRVGYQWIGPQSSEHVSHLPKRRGLISWSAAASTLVLTAALFYFTGGAATDPASPESRQLPGAATRAWLSNKDIVVEFEGGCRGVLVNEGEKDIGKPVLSADGQQVAFTVREDQQCRLVTVELAKGTRSEFGNCPTSVI